MGGVPLEVLEDWVRYDERKKAAGFNVGMKVNIQTNNGKRLGPYTIIDRRNDGDESEPSIKFKVEPLDKSQPPFWIPSFWAVSFDGA